MDQNIEAMLKTAIQTKVIEAFNTTPQMVEKLVQAAFSKEVSEHGGPRSDSYRAVNMPWIDWLVGEEIRNAAKEAVRDYIASHKDEIRSKVDEAMKRGDYGTKIGEQFAQIMEREWTWNFNINMKDLND